MTQFNQHVLGLNSPFLLHPCQSLPPILWESLLKTKGLAGNPLSEALWNRTEAIFSQLQEKTKYLKGMKMNIIRYYKYKGDF